MTGIELHGVEKSYGKNQPVIENLDLQIGEGGFTILLGPSGCGKSTILRMIAGLEKETAGKIFINGEDMEGVSPGAREIAMVFQNYALYPTMTVKENIEFGLKNIHVPKPEREARIGEAVKMVGLAEYINRKPQHLSGGQRQRVALARAIVKKPRVFLMDEPLSNLDAKLRAQIRTDLIELHRNLGVTFVYVTHDQVEAMSMGTDIVLLENGKVRQQGTPGSIYSAPRNLFTAQFIGSPPMNIIRAENLAPGVRLPNGAASLGFRPENAVVSSDGNADEGRASFRGELVAREILGDHAIYKFKTAHGNIHTKSMSGRVVEYGEWFVGVEGKHLYFFDEHGDAITQSGGKNA
ncbi:MAG: ABC transporter ATP-binding protein [Synergistaceae bacterium]|jgi:sn-glycerol 3-phosphate transport system ATP-binding protein|nr:ABC transporter ATP-binding protein [Synergistaceae bacterium]